MNEKNETLKPNKLINEKSPYLLQHAYNPVDWYPWGDEAFNKAKEEDKPVFLSIGYSTCHWCHVMERESFEDKEVAKLMNETFVSIKVDREERPDIDNIYMTVCQMMTGGGGWPLTIIMTPDKKPFFSGTYFPKNDRGGRIGMVSLARQIKEAWKSRKEDIDKITEDIISHLEGFSNEQPGSLPGKEIFDVTFNGFAERFDRENGGFGKAPKFPSPQNFLFLIRYYNATGDKEAINMVTHTLKQMRMGGVYDHLGFGFHRYSTDEKWLLPHFEKMLYDQAMLLMAYTEAYQVTGDNFFMETAYEIVEYVMRDLSRDGGGYFSAEDADSEGEEGKFYIWSVSELESILDENDVDLVKDFYNLNDEGNFLDEATKSLTKQNIFYTKLTIKEYANEKGIEEAELRANLERINQVLFDKREKRIRPLKDDKVLADWNGLMIAAMAKASRVFGLQQALESAIDAASFIDRRMKIGEKLLHRYRDNEATFTANLDDYAFYVWGLTELYEATADFDFLGEAVTLTKIMVADFWDSDKGAFFFTPTDSEELLVRKKEIFDAAIPSGNSVAALNLLRLGRITGNTEWEDKAEQLFKYAAGPLEKAPTAFTMLQSALAFLLGKSTEILIAGDENSEDCQEIVAELNKKYLPNNVLVHIPANKTRLEKIAEYTKNYNTIDGKVTVYVCSNYTCKLPVHTIKEVLEQLDL